MKIKAYLQIVKPLPFGFAKKQKPEVYAYSDGQPLKRHLLRQFVSYNVSLCGGVSVHADTGPR